MARTVADTALLFSVMAGPDHRSPIALETPGEAFRTPPVRDLEGLRVADRVRVWRAGLAFFDRFDVLFAPVSQVPPFPIEQEYPPYVAGVQQHTYLDWMRSAYHVTMLGAPALSMPAGRTPDGLPIGLQIVTRPRSDLLTLQVGAAFERARA